ncbi:MAG: hypothetical protein ACTSWY_01410, partial [Promethearchaeota archaeon]
MSMNKSGNNSGKDTNNEKKNSKSNKKINVRSTQEMGLINEINGYEIKIIINKDEIPNPIYPIKSPMPIYTTDAGENVFLIYEQNLITPGGDLPSLNIIGDAGNVITLNPAKHFILQSALSNFQGSAVLISESSVPQPMESVRRIESENLPRFWKKYGFKHLKHIQDIIKSEKFKIFMRVFSELFLDIIIRHEKIRKLLLKNLVEIGSDSGLNDSEDYLNILAGFMNEESAALVLENKKAGVKTFLKSKVLQYGDLISFPEGNKTIMGVIKEINLTAEVEPVFEILNDKPTTFVSALKMGMEGKIHGAEEIIDRLFGQLGPKFIRIPVGKVPKINKDYEIVLKGNELIHFAIIAISGSGKGNLLKEFLYETLKKMVLYEKNNGNLKGYNGH